MTTPQPLSCFTCGHLYDPDHLLIDGESRCNNLSCECEMFRPRPESGVGEKFGRDPFHGHVVNVKQPDMQKAQEIVDKNHSSQPVAGRGEKKPSCCGKKVIRKVYSTGEARYECSECGRDNGPAPASTPEGRVECYRCHANVTKTGEDLYWCTACKMHIRQATGSTPEGGGEVPRFPLPTIPGTHEDTVAKLSGKLVDLFFNRDAGWSEKLEHEIDVALSTATAAARAERDGEIADLAQKMKKTDSNGRQKYSWQGYYNQALEDICTALLQPSPEATGGDNQKAS